MSDLDDIPLGPATTEQAPAGGLNDIPLGDTKLKDNYNATSRVPADEAAKVIGISTRTGASPAAVAANMKDAEAADRRPSDEFFDDVSTNYPKTAALLSDPASMAKVHDDLGNLVGHEHVVQSFEQATNYWQAVKAGLQGSVFGHVYDRGAPSIVTGPKSSYGQHIVSAALGMGADFPFMVIGGAGATAAAAPVLGPAAPLAAGPGAFALPAFLKSSIAEYNRTGDLTGVRNDLEKAFNVAKETGKQAVVGLITELTGGAVNKAAVGAFLPTAEQMAGMTLKQTLTKMAAQNTAMTVSGAGVEGRAPTINDFSTNAILMAGLEGVHYAGANVYDAPQSQANKNYVQVLDEFAKQSEFRKRDAAGYAAHMNEIADPEHMPGVPVEAFEKAFPQAAQTAERMGLLDAYTEAKATGGDVKIPMGTFLSEAMDPHRAKLADDVRFDPDSKTVNQLKAEQEEAAANQEKEQAAAQTKEQGPVAGIVSQVRKALGMEEPAAKPEAKEPEVQAPVAAPTPEPVSSDPAIAEREQASRKEIGAAQLDLGLLPQKIEGVDPRLAELHAKMEKDALASAERILMKPQLEEMKAEQGKDRASLEAAARVQFDNDPLYQAEEFLEKRLGKNTYTKYAAGELSPEHAHLFDAIAEVHGFSSGSELAGKLIASPRKEAAIKAFVDDLMPKPIRNTPEFRVEALKAIHNEKMPDLLALKAEIFDGMKTGAKQEGEYREQVHARARAAAEEAKEYARGVIASKSVGEAGRFRSYFTAERDAALRSYKAAERGDYEAAAKATREQLQAHALASEALRARDRIETMTRSLVKAQKSEMESFKTQEHFDQAAAILNRFGFTREDFNPTQKTEKLADWVERMNEKTGAVDIAPWLADESIAKNYKDLTVPQLNDVRNAVKNIKRVANTENEMWTMRKGEGFDAISEELHAAKEANTKGGKTRGAGTYENNWDKLIRRADSVRQALVSIETLMAKLDGYERKGTWQDLFIESKARHQDVEASMHADAAGKWKELHGDYTPKELSDMDANPIWIPELNDNLTKNNLLTLAANQGTEGNAEKVRSLLGLKDGQRVEVPQETVDRILARHLDARDWKLTQAKLDWLESYKPQIAALYKKLTGFEPEWVQAKPIATKDGELRGGYYPLIADPRVTVRGFEEMAADESLNNPPPTWKASTANGFTEARNKYARYAVSLDANGLVRHVSDVIHDLSMREWVLDANRLLGNKSVQADLVDALGMEQFQGIKTWVKQIAGNDVKPLRGAIEDISGDMRRRSTIAMLGSKISVMLSQFHGITAAGAVDENFGALDIAKGLGEAYGDLLKSPSSFKEMSEWVDEQSAYMKQKERNADRDLADANRKTFGHDDKLMRFANYGFGLIDGLVTKPIWRQAYRRGLELENGDHDAAVAYADRIIRNSSVSGRKSDLPEMMRGSELNALVTMFHGFVDRQFQLMYRAADQVEKPADLAKFAGTGMAVMVIPNMIYALTHDVFAQGADQKKKWIKAGIKSMSPLSVVPIANTLQDMAIDAAQGKRVNASMTAVSGIVDAYKELLEKSASRKARTQQKIEAAAHLANYTGLPIPGYFMHPIPEQFNRWIFNTVDYVEKGMKPQAADLLQRRPAKQRH